MFEGPVLFYVLVTIASASSTSNETCFGLDISKDPRLEASKIDGWWFQQRISKQALSIVPANSIFFWQFQGRSAWAIDWIPETQNCTYRQFEESQQQSATVGPFSPCWNSRQVLPIKDEEATPVVFLYWVPTRNILMIYACFGDMKGKKCLFNSFAGVLTRTREISLQELNTVRKQLRNFGVSMDTLAVVNPRENHCPLPKTTLKEQMGDNQKSERKNYRY